MFLIEKNTSWVVTVPSRGDWLASGISWTGKNALCHNIINQKPTGILSKQYFSTWKIKSGLWWTWFVQVSGQAFLCRIHMEFSFGPWASETRGCRDCFEAGLRATQAPSGQMSALGMEDTSPTEMREQLMDSCFLLCERCRGEIPPSVTCVRQAGLWAQNQFFLLFIHLLFAKVPCCSTASNASPAFLMKNAVVHLFSNSLHWFSGLFFLPPMYKKHWVAECGID